MKKIILVWTLLVISGSIATAQSSNYEYYKNNYDKFSDTDCNCRQLFLHDRIYIKIKKDVQVTEGKTESPQSFQGALGIPSLDKLIRKYNAKAEHTFKLRAELPEKVKRRMTVDRSQLPDLSKIYTIIISSPVNIRKVVGEFSHDPNLEYAELVPADYPTAQPNDTMYSEQQHLPQIHSEEAWDIHKGENGTEPIIIGICDTGVDWAHPDLNANIWQNLGEDANHNGHVIEYDPVDSLWIFDTGDINGVDDDGNGYIDDFIGWDFLKDHDADDQGNDPMDYYGHGTHVAGLSAGVTDNTTGIAAVSWNVKILASSHSSPSFNSIMRGFEGIVYLAENGADIINCSWGGGAYSATNAASIDYAFGLGSILVISAGNNNDEELFYPTAFPHVIGVASVDSADGKAYYSSYGLHPDISSPGGDVRVDGGLLSSVLNFGYARYQGTSMASPVAAGVFGLLKSYHPGWDKDKIITQIIGTTDYIDTLNPEYTNKLGSGRVNAYRALTETNVSLPQKLRLDLVRAVPNDDAANGNGALEPGELINLGFIIRNYAHYVSSDNVQFKISTTDPDIEIVTDTYTGAVGADGFTEIPPEFEIRIKPYTKSKFATMTLDISSDDIEIALGTTHSFEIPIAAGGILVFEGRKGGRGLSGTFLQDFISKRGYNVLYTNEFPAALNGFDAVFLSFGCWSDWTSGSTGFDDWKADVVKKFLESGGKLYLEGGEALGWDQKDNSELLSLFGIDSTDDGDDDHSLDTLMGQGDAITNNQMFVRSLVPSYKSIDRAYPVEGTIAFEELNYGTVGVQYEAAGYKTFYFSYPLAELYDVNIPNCRYELVKRIMDFFGLPFEYTVPQFTPALVTGHAPLQVEFRENSLTSIPTVEWQWDFDNDAITDATSKYPVYTYTVPGDFTPTMTVSNHLHTHTLSHEAYVFDGESALYCSGSGLAKTDTVPGLNLTGKMTLEAWINPKSHGQGNYGRIIDKNQFLLFITRNKAISFNTNHEDGSQGNVVTPDNAISFNNWQHVAATFDGDTTIKIYINGIEQSCNITATPQGNINDNSNEPLVIGNRINYGRAFDGRIDEVRIWNIERTQQQIQNSLNFKLNGNESGLVGYWRFQEGTGNSSADITSNHNNCSVEGSWRQGWHEDVIKIQPTDVTVCKDSIATISVNAVGSEGDSLGYRWYKELEPLENGGRIAGADSSVLVISNVNEADAGQYYVKVSMFTGEPIGRFKNSEKAQLTVKIALRISKQPENQLVNESSIFTLSVEVEGSEPLTYQWYRNDVILNGANSPQYSKVIEPWDEATYFCKVTNSCGTVNSTTATVAITTGVGETLPIEKASLSSKPQPFSDNTIITVNMAQRSYAELAISDIFGRSVAKLFKGELDAGTKRFEFKSSEYNLPSGIYFCVLTLSNNRVSIPLYLIR